MCPPPGISRLPKDKDSGYTSKAGSAWVSARSVGKSRIHFYLPALSRIILVNRPDTPAIHPGTKYGVQYLHASSSRHVDRPFDKFRRSSHQGVNFIRLKNPSNMRSFGHLSGYLLQRSFTLGGRNENRSISTAVSSNRRFNFIGSPYVYEGHKVH